MVWWDSRKRAHVISQIREISALLGIKGTKIPWPHIGLSLTWIHFWAKDLTLPIVCLKTKLTTRSCSTRRQIMARKFWTKMSTKHFGSWFLHGGISDLHNLVPLAGLVILCIVVLLKCNTHIKFNYCLFVLNNDNSILDNRVSRKSKTEFNRHLNRMRQIWWFNSHVLLKKRSFRFPMIPYLFHTARNVRARFVN